MGGKNAIIVDADADLDEAAGGVIASAFGYAGQKCSACSRAIVMGEAYGRFLDRLVEATRSLTTGPPEDGESFLGALVGRQPFGGFGYSGLGPKAGGGDYLLQFLLPQIVTENTTRHGFVA